MGTFRLGHPLDEANGDRNLVGGFMLELVETLYARATCNPASIRLLAQEVPQLVPFRVEA